MLVHAYGIFHLLRCMTYFSRSSVIESYNPQVTPWFLKCKKALKVQLKLFWILPFIPTNTIYQDQSKKKSHKQHLSGPISVKIDLVVFLTSSFKDHLICGWLGPTFMLGKDVKPRWRSFILESDQIEAASGSCYVYSIRIKNHCWNFLNKVNCFFPITIPSSFCMILDRISHQAQYALSPPFSNFTFFIIFTECNSSCSPNLKGEFAGTKCLLNVTMRKKVYWPCWVPWPPPRDFLNNSEQRDQNPLRRES